MEVPYSDSVKEHYPSYLTDESHLVEVEDIERIYFPRTTSELAEVIKRAVEQEVPVTISGGGTGIAGGRVPLSGWLVATDHMRSVHEGVRWKDAETGVEYEYSLQVLSDDHAIIRVPPSITVKALQNLVRELGWFYPPDPTERSAFIGGNLSTNASGARSFKYGATREWVHGATVVLPSGDVVYLSREDPVVGDEIEIGRFRVPRPSYSLPQTRKNVAGPVITDSSKPLDLFIGTDGIFGVFTEVELKLIRPPLHILSIFVYCDGLEQAIELVSRAQQMRAEAGFPVPMAVEFLDERALYFIRKEENIPAESRALVIIEQDVWSDTDLDDAVEHWVNVFDELSVMDSSVASTHKEIEHHKFLRHLVPESVNAIAHRNGQPKLGTDYSVPLGRSHDLFSLALSVGQRFEEHVGISAEDLERGNFGYVLWAHAGDAHVHLNLLPRNEEEREYAKGLMVKMMEQVVQWGGSIAAEHGLGKKRFNGQPALVIQYGAEVLEVIRDMKSTLDPKFLLNRGNLV